MVQFYASLFIRDLDRLHASASKMHSLASEKGAEGKVEKEDAAELSSGLRAIWDVCHSMGMKGSVAMCRRLVGILRESSACSYSIVENHLLGIRSEIVRELGEYDFLYIKRDDAQYFEYDDLFGESVARRFVEARPEVRNAGNCIAFGLHTAAVFHLMRVVELGLRAVATQLGVSEVKGNKAVEFGTWEDVIRALVTKNDERFPQTTEGQQDSDYYKGLFREFRNFKDCFRNYVMHTRIDYNERDARYAFGYVRDFMRRLAERESLNDYII